MTKTRAEKEEELQRMTAFSEERDTMMGELETVRQEKKWQENLDNITKEKFPDYVRLNHHLARFQINNILKQHSEETPTSEKSAFNMFTGGERETEQLLTKRDEMRRSKKYEEEMSMEEFFNYSHGKPHM